MLGVLQDKTNITKVYNMEEYMWTKKQSQMHGGAVNMAGAAMCHVSVGTIWEKQWQCVAITAPNSSNSEGEGMLTQYVMALAVLPMFLHLSLRFCVDLLFLILSISCLQLNP